MAKQPNIISTLTYRLARFRNGTYRLEIVITFVDGDRRTIRTRIDSEGGQLWLAPPLKAAS